MTTQRLVLDQFPRPEIARALSPNGRPHWTARRVARLLVTDVVTVAAVRSGLRHMHGHVTIQPVWVFEVARRRDGDNLTSILKAVQDSLVRGGWLADDSVEHVTLLPPEVRIERGKRALELSFEWGDGT